MQSAGTAPIKGSLLGSGTSQGDSGKEDGYIKKTEGSSTIEWQKTWSLSCTVQGGESTHIMYTGTFNDEFSRTLLPNLPVDFGKSVSTWKNYRPEYLPKSVLQLSGLCLGLPG